MPVKNKDFLKTYCDEFIIKESGINRKIIVLCEGGDDNLLKKLVEEPPLELGNNFLGQYQDASFYNHCIPKWWQKATQDDIVFHICGNQSNVIEAYFYITKIYQEKNDKRLNANKVYALVDIDFERGKLSEIKKKYPEMSYPFDSLEAIYQDLYQQGNVNQITAKNHKIWVTGLLHKEAYFFIPALKNLFPEITSDENYFDILKQMPTENEKDFSIAKANKRIAHHETLYQFDSVTEFQQKWQTAFNNSELSETEKDQLVYALLTVAKSKTVWEKIIPHPAATNKEIKTYRNQLSHKIASKFYAQEDRNSPHHLPSFFNALSVYS